MWDVLSQGPNWSEALGVQTRPHQKSSGSRAQPEEQPREPWRRSRGKGVMPETHCPERSAQGVGYRNREARGEGLSTANTVHCRQGSDCGSDGSAASGKLRTLQNKAMSPWDP